MANDFKLPKRMYEWPTKGERKSEVLGTNVSPSMLEAFRALSEESGFTQAQILRWVIMQILEANLPEEWLDKLR